MNKTKIICEKNSNVPSSGIQSVVATVSTSGDRSSPVDVAGVADLLRRSRSRARSGLRSPYTSSSCVRVLDELTE